MTPRNMSNRHMFSAMLLAVLTVIAGCGDSPDKEGGAEGSVQAIIDKSERLEGFLEVLQDKESGELHLLLDADDFDKEFIHHHMTVNGNVPAGHFVGRYGTEQILSLRRHFDRVEFVQHNTKFYFNPESALSRAQAANRPDAILAVEEVVAENEDQVVVRLDSVLLKEQLTQIKPTPNPDIPPNQAFGLGKLSDKRSKVVSVKNYPQNTAVVTEYVYENPAPAVPGGDDVTDTRSMSVQVQHSFVAIPDNDFKPRRADYRVGYFTDRITDLTDPGFTPFKDVIQRWHLVKKDPDAELSDPVEPITWWIENTTPHEWRDLIRDAALAWNSAFEKAGFTNAIAVKIQPDDADWDAGDIRYNVLRWTSSPVVPFGGYGPSFSNPRTGQIIGADVMLEFAYVRNHRRAQLLMQPDAQLAHPHFSHPHLGHDPRHCSAGMQMSENYLFGQAALGIYAQDSEKQQQLLRESMTNLILHEIGHAIGLMHNMRATQVIDDPFDQQQVDTVGLSGSVMDYADINFAPAHKTQTAFYLDRPGTYDDWVIEYGYSPAVADANAEEARLEKILARSGEPGLEFGNDADDMRAPTNGIDPHVQIGDLSSDALGYAQGVLDHLRVLAGDLTTKHVAGEDTFDALPWTYTRLVGRHRAVSDVIASYVGGVHLQRLPPALIEGVPYEPVSYQQQTRAMALLRKYVFAPDIMLGDEELFASLQYYRRGFDFYGQPEDPKLHSLWHRNQVRVLDRLLHANTLQRLTDSRLYGNQYSVASMLDDLSTAIFDADKGGDVNTLRQTLQVAYVNKLSGLMAPEAGVDTVARGAAYAQLEDTLEWLRKKRRGNEETRAHTAYLVYLIEKGLDLERRA